jgi:hypothetical protein
MKSFTGKPVGLFLFGKDFFVHDDAVASEGLQDNLGVRVRGLGRGLLLLTIFAKTT